MAVSQFEFYLPRKHACLRAPAKACATAIALAHAVGDTRMATPAGREFNLYQALLHSVSPWLNSKCDIT
jgi:hypothetical protein